MKYVATKVLKRLESNNIRGAFKDPQKTLLLPVSFGVSSITLLHALDQQLCNRLKQGRHAGYNLHVLFVDQSKVLRGSSLQESIQLLKLKYPSHTYSTISLEDCFDYGISFAGILEGGREQMEDTISALPSPTSKVDFIDTARRRLIIAFAKSSSCDSILFADSTTRLAEKALSETAKGRGVALPWFTADSDSSGINITYPLRDLLRKELTAYASVVSPPLTPLILEVSAPAPTSSRDTTIDDLMSQYFESVEQNYPSIVANVVRTSGRLVAPAIAESNRTCDLCGHRILSESWGGEKESADLSLSLKGSGYTPGKALCYGCAKTLVKD